MLARLGLGNNIGIPAVTGQSPPLCPPELTQMGVQFEQWNVPDDVDLTRIDSKNPADALIAEMVMQGYVLLQRLYELRTSKGSMRLVNLHPETPDLSELLIEFQQIHDHATPEIQLILGGEGIFNIYGEQGQHFEIQVQKGNFLFIPAGVAHNFELTDKHTIQALQVFQDKDGEEATPRILFKRLSAPYSIKRPGDSSSLHSKL